MPFSGPTTKGNELTPENGTENGTGAPRPSLAGEGKKNRWRKKTKPECAPKIQNRTNRGNVIAHRFEWFDCCLILCLCKGPLGVCTIVLKETTCFITFGGTLFRFANAVKTRSWQKRTCARQIPKCIQMQTWKIPDNYII